MYNLNNENFEFLNSYKLNEKYLLVPELNELLSYKTIGKYLQI